MELHTGPMTLRHEAITPISGSPCSAITDIEGELVIDEGGQEVIAGRFKMLYVDFLESGFEMPEIINEAHELQQFGLIFDEGREMYSDQVAALLGPLIQERPNLIILESLELIEKYRGLGIGKKIVDRALKLYGNQAEVAVLNAFPMQMNHPIRSDEWMRSMNYRDLDGDMPKATANLIGLFEGMGFQQLPDRAVMVKNLWR
ncbi:GNAT superfamily N-acetyltransferase [Pseudomonas nitritireducens]|uniref:GNAT superfamily N-acetyltransferase n=1 Tax=Pseudomonas nitroreducens TaxID=46680 RepID=A0A7W7P387_PSENT|nr:hypothetical protein [Pseudomonas nitritireducens]MBB4865310.1 GNAT superfamily N-acetyltransferase [Pseudomonas nitritireducens]